MVRASGLCVGLLLCAIGMPMASAQTSPIQGTNIVEATSATNAPQPARVYRPTSLEPDDPFDLPRTPQGRPDFQGVVWDANFFTFLQAGAGPELVVPEAAAKATFEQMVANFAGNSLIALDPEIEGLVRNAAGLPIVRGERRTRLLVLPADGRMPFTAEARKEMQAASRASAQIAAARADNPEDRPPSERCLIMMGLAPLSPMGASNPRQFIQTPTHIVIQTEYGGEARIIPFADRRTSAPLPSSLGNSTARWDGDTLVIETTGMPASARLRPFPVLIVNPDAKVIERYTLLSRKELLYQYTIEDPKVYAAPWLAEYSLFVQPHRMYEHACHEGNYSLPNILSGQRVADEKATQPRGG
jgi:hypothetical protein